MLLLNNRAIIDYQITSLPSSNIKSLIIILGHQSDKLKNHIENLKLEYPVKYYYNDKYKETNCAYSLMLAENEISEGFVLINCDLLFTKENVEKLLLSKYENTIVARKNNLKKMDLQKLVVKNNKVVKWELDIYESNAEVMGPLIMNKLDAKKVVKYYKSLGYIEQKQMHCFSLFSHCIDNIVFSPMYINDNDWCEIDSENDLKNAQKTIIINKSFSCE